MAAEVAEDSVTTRSSYRSTVMAARLPRCRRWRSTAFRTGDGPSGPWRPPWWNGPAEALARPAPRGQAQEPHGGVTHEGVGGLAGERQIARGLRGPLHREERVVGGVEDTSEAA